MEYHFRKYSYPKTVRRILVLKNKIKELEKIQDYSIQNAVIEKNKNNLLHYDNWVSDCTLGLGHDRLGVDTRKHIPVNTLNAPDSYTDVFNSLALGRDGQVTIGFSKPISDTLIVCETTSAKNITESAVVEVSMDGKNWLLYTKFNIIMIVHLCMNIVMICQMLVV